MTRLLHVLVVSARPRGLYSAAASACASRMGVQHSSAMARPANLRCAEDVARSRGAVAALSRPVLALPAYPHGHPPRSMETMALPTSRLSVGCGRSPGWAAGRNDMKTVHTVSGSAGESVAPSHALHSRDQEGPAYHADLFLDRLSLVHCHAEIVC